MRHANAIRSMLDAPVDEINRQRRSLDPDGEQIINLGQAVPWFGPPDGALAALAGELGEMTTQLYTPDPGLPALRMAIAEDLRDRYGDRGADADTVLVTAGANHAFLIACTALLEPGDRVGLLSPFFLNHHMAVEGCGASAVEILPEPGRRMRYEPGRLEDLIRRHKLRAIVMVNPSNPTGKLFTSVELGEILEVCRAHNVWLISDEVYRAFTYGDEQATTIGALDGAEDVSITLGSFSKEFGMTGWRVGWLRAPAASIRQFLKVQDYSIICAPHASQRLALAALTGWPGWARSHLRELERRRDLIQEALDDCGHFDVYQGQGGFFVWFRPKDGLGDGEGTFELMRDAGVCLLPGSIFGPSWRGWYRLSFGKASAADLRQAAGRIIRYFAD